MQWSKRRERFRAILSAPGCVYPASVFDAISARIAADLGFEMGMLAGSVGAMAVLGAPDLVVLTLTEFAEQAYRISRAADLPLMVDADHGYGNALNVRRTVEELEAAGLAALTIEDTALPAPFGGDDKSLISPDEGERKIRAAVSARSDARLVIVARSAAASVAGIDAAIERAKRYEDAGADALFFSGIRSEDQLSALRQRLNLPILLGAVPPILADRKALAAFGVRICLQGHRPFFAAMRACHEALAALADEARPEAIQGPAADVLARVTRRADYERWTAEYLRP
jgi:carboxyvinyl-carboxyphosphonate phosphorylmutase